MPTRHLLWLLVAALLVVDHARHTHVYRDFAKVVPGRTRPLSAAGSWMVESTTIVSPAPTAADYLPLRRRQESRVQYAFS